MTLTPEQKSEFRNSNHTKTKWTDTQRSRLIQLYKDKMDELGEEEFFDRFDEIREEAHKEVDAAVTDEDIPSVENGGIAIEPPANFRPKRITSLPVYAVLQICDDRNHQDDIEWICADSIDELSETARDLDAKVLWRSSSSEECERIVALNRQAIDRLGSRRWQDIRRVLSFRGNFVSGYRIYIEAWSKPAQGKYFTEPCAVDKSIEWMIENEILRPSRFAIQPERAGAVGLIGYNREYIKHTLPVKPIPGHYVDWDYEVMVEVLSPYV